jgi:hypothetical protein
MRRPALWKTKTPSDKGHKGQHKPDVYDIEAWCHGLSCAPMYPVASATRASPDVDTAGKINFGNSSTATETGSGLDGVSGESNEQQLS